MNSSHKTAKQRGSALDDIVPMTRPNIQEATDFTDDSLMAMQVRMVPADIPKT
jgi:hypothetical protein